MAQRSNAKTRFQAPTGTRDMYPEDLLRARYIEKLWRDTSIRHGFDEIDGPTFEHLDLYTVKSGDGIVSELFSFRRDGGKKDYALRPEFTPTLARMYAARANALPKPCKWFWMQNCFRAERPQRGRLREFRQWNCDIVGEGLSSEETSDGELLSCVLGCIKTTGLLPGEIIAKISDRRAIQRLFLNSGIEHDKLTECYTFLDRYSNLDSSEREDERKKLGLPHDLIAELTSKTGLYLPKHDYDDVEESRTWVVKEILQYLLQLTDTLKNNLSFMYVDIDPSIIRGLAYYTGMVFEVIADGERAVAGGGRYDNLIELFGGPPTPAVGFGMGDVVLSLLLEDKGLMPTGRDLVDALSQPAASIRPDVFVVSNGSDDAESQIVPTIARLRAGVESETWRSRDDHKPWDADRYAVRPMHARRTYKATRNVGKLLKEAGNLHARYVAILESAEHCTLKNQDTNEQAKNVLIAEVGAKMQSIFEPGIQPR